MTKTRGATLFACRYRSVFMIAHCSQPLGTMVWQTADLLVIHHCHLIKCMAMPLRFHTRHCFLAGASCSYGLSGNCLSGCMQTFRGPHTLFCLIKCRGVSRQHL